MYLHNAAAAAADDDDVVCFVAVADFHTSVLEQLTLARHDYDQSATRSTRLTDIFDVKLRSDLNLSFSDVT